LASSVRYALDTSIAIALLSEGDPQHAAVLDKVGDHVLALAGHAAFETYSVLTRMPEYLRLHPNVAAEVIRTGFPEWCTLSARGTNRLLQRLPDLGVVGGAVYDALVAAAALENDRVLLSSDLRAETTYRKVGVTYELVA
jgi:hypothetical protein